MALTTQKQVDAVKEPGRYAVQGEPGLRLQVTASEAKDAKDAKLAKSWVLRWEYRDADGRRKERMLGLGPLHTVDLREAKERARKARLALLDGHDPIEQGRSARAARHADRAREAAAGVTFEAAAKLYYKHHQAKWSSAKWRGQ
ncbi:MAG TPA: Arm DNA-binding domain-containing protein, partial [Roseiarcus sp.]|nr:Arm DNA-binding domain-containing protein [Roseiarcus sp.]